MLSKPATRRLLQAMPKAELHLHLDGCLRVATALELARSRNVDAPRTYGGMFDALVAPARPGSQFALLRAFELPIALMQDEESLERVTYELVVDKAADRVAYLEIKWAPALHTAGGLSLDNVIQAVCRGMRAGSRASGAVATATCVAVRSHTPEFNIQVAEAAARFSSDGVTGFDLAGLEAEFPDPLIHADAFAVAREADLGITLHAGELDDEGAAVWRALELRPSRIAHGATAVHDPALQAALAERGVTLDLCPTSNVQAGTVADIGSHPLAHLLRAGVPVTVSTDDVTVSDVTLSEEFENSHSAIGLALPELWRANLHALDVAFVDEAARRELRERFETWAAPIPELQG